MSQVHSQLSSSSLVDSSAHARIDSLEETLTRFIQTSEAEHKETRSEIRNVNIAVRSLSDSVTSAKAVQGRVSTPTILTAIALIVGLAGLGLTMITMVSALVFFTINARLTPVETVLGGITASAQVRAKEIEDNRVGIAGIRADLTKIEGQFTRRSQLSYLRSYGNWTGYALLFHQINGYDPPRPPEYLYESEYLGGSGNGK